MAEYKKTKQPKPLFDNEPDYVKDHRARIEQVRKEGKLPPQYNTYPTVWDDGTITLENYIKKPTDGIVGQANMFYPEELIFSRDKNAILPMRTGLHTAQSKRRANTLTESGKLKMSQNESIFIIQQKKERQKEKENGFVFPHVEYHKTKPGENFWYRRFIKTVNLCTPGTVRGGNETCDCLGAWSPTGWITDGFCDDGSWIYHGHPVVFNCEIFNYQNGACGGKNTIGQDTCPPGYIQDCDGTGFCVDILQCGDGYQNCHTQPFGVDLSCYYNDCGGCFHQGSERTVNGNNQGPDSAASYTISQTMNLTEKIPEKK